ncbi:MAG: flavoprotein [Akkermansia sp.]
MPTIILGVTGSIAAYKAADIVSHLVKLRYEVYCVCTAKALEFITPLTLQTMSRNQVYSSFEDEKNDWMPPHIDLASRADLLVIAPATANTLAEFAHGLAPDMLSSLYLANRAPVLICPAMNTMMWAHEATQNNIKTLASRKNHYILDPASDGILACGVEGQGKLAPVDDIITRIQELCPAQR